MVQSQEPSSLMFPSSFPLPSLHLVFKKKKKFMYTKSFVFFILLWVLHLSKSCPFILPPNYLF
uniref:Uncharacterized protein n=1 Tax=Brassica campestris TaxID=3711 RepID=A0A3P5Y8I6_BRACM|nr:unnamed protein product [Brassica rapa]